MAAPIGQPRDRDPNLAAVGHGARATRIERADQPNRARESAVTALCEVEARRSRQGFRDLRADDEERVAPERDADRLRRHARQIDDHFDRGSGLEDIHSRATLCGEGRGARDVAIQFKEQPPGVVGQVRRILTQDIAGHVSIIYTARGERSEPRASEARGWGPARFKKSGQ